MKIRVSILWAIVAFGIVTAVGLAAMLATSTFALNQLRVGGPLYSQIKLGNDLVADILPPPAYVLEGYLEATLAMRDPSQLSVHKGRLTQLHKDYSERQAYWSKSELEPAVKKTLTLDSDAEVQKFWSVVEQEMLPALSKGDKEGAERADKKLESIYAAHRGFIDDVVKRANDSNSKMEGVAAGQVSSFSLVVWVVSGLVAALIVFGVLGIAVGMVRPVVRLTAAMEDVAAGNIGVVVPGAGRSDEIGGMARAIAAIRNNAEQKARDEAETKRRLEQAAAQQRKADIIKLANDFEGAVGEIIETVSSASSELEASAGTLTRTAIRSQDIRQRISGLQGGMLDIVAAMRQSGETVESGTVSVRDAGNMIKTINATVDAVSRNMSMIAEVVQQQMAATNEVDASISATANMSNDALAAIERLACAVDRVGEVVQPRLQEHAKHLSDRTLVQLARSDHASFKKRVIDTLVGRGQAKARDLADHHSCRFGKWYDGLKDLELRHSAAYRKIEGPHLRVHACGKEALAKFQAGDFEAAVIAAGEMDNASDEVFAALDEMAALLAAREQNSV